MCNGSVGLGQEVGSDYEYWAVIRYWRSTHEQFCRVTPAPQSLLFPAETSTFDKIHRIEPPVSNQTIRRFDGAHA